jgi:hypothetical protein
MRVLWLLLLAPIAFNLGGCSGDGLTQNDLPVQCLDKPQPGACKKRVIRYFYDYRSDRCRTFQYGGCGGRVPFETLEECEKTCLGGGG